MDGLIDPPLEPNTIRILRDQLNSAENAIYRKLGFASLESCQPSSVFPALNNPYGTPPYPQPQPKKQPEPKEADKK